MTNEMDGQMSLSDLDTWYGKTCREPSAQVGGRTSNESSKKRLGLSSQTRPICLCLNHGASQDASATRWEDGALLGEYTMRSFGEYPREENVSRLSQILEDSAHQKYYLSARACFGILRRTKAKGKELPDVLRVALERQMHEHKRPMPE